MLEENLALPFETQILGVRVTSSASTSSTPTRSWRSAAEARAGKRSRSSTREKPSFLERAKTRWRARQVENES